VGVAGTGVVSVGRMMIGWKSMKMRKGKGITEIKAECPGSNLEYVITEYMDSITCCYCGLRFGLNSEKRLPKHKRVISMSIGPKGKY
jgi:hypothetical protein